MPFLLVRSGDLTADSVLRNIAVRRFLLAGLAALALVAGPLIYPLASSRTLAQASERTIFDATIVAIPPAAAAPCMLVGTGRITARAVLTGHPAPQPVTLRLAGYEQGTPVVGASLPVGRDEVGTTLPLTDGLVCWTVEVSPAVDLSTADVTERSAYVQYVALTMTLAPE